MQLFGVNGDDLSHNTAANSTLTRGSKSSQADGETGNLDGCTSS